MAAARWVACRRSVRSRGGGRAGKARAAAAAVLTTAVLLATRGPGRAWADADADDRLADALFEWPLDPGAVRIALEHGADASAVLGDGQQTPRAPALQHALMADPNGTPPEARAAAVQALVDHGANVYAALPDGTTALHLSALSLQLNATEILLAAGANPCKRLRRDNQFTPLLAVLMHTQQMERVTAAVGLSLASRPPGDPTDMVRQVRAQFSEATARVPSVRALLHFNDGGDGDDTFRPTNPSHEGGAYDDAYDDDAYDGGDDRGAAAGGVAAASRVPDAATPAMPEGAPAAKFLRAELRAPLDDWVREFVRAMVEAPTLKDKKDVRMRCAAAADPFYGRTPLHYAAQAGDPATVELLIASGVSAPAQRDAFGFTPADVGMAYGHVAAARAIEQGGDVLASEAPPPAPGRVRTAVRADDDPRPPPSWARGPERGAAPRGGWAGGAAPEYDVLDEGECDIDVLEGVPDADDFFERYVSRSRPALLRGAAKGPWRKHFQRSAFVQRHGDVMFDVGGIPYPMLYGLKGGRKMRARRFARTAMGANRSAACFEAEEGAAACEPGMLCWDAVREARRVRCTAEPLYVFSRIFPADEASARLLDDLPLPPKFLRYASRDGNGTAYMKRLVMDSLENSGTQIFLGPARSGAPVHFHDHAANFLAYGYKRWLLWPPASSFWTTKHIGRWLGEDYHNATKDTRPLECRQGPGDVMYVPALWGHGVINLTPTAGFAQEFSTMFAVNPNSIGMVTGGLS